MSSYTIYHKQYWERHKNKIMKRTREYQLEYQKAYYQKHKKEIAKKYKERKKS